FDAGGLENTSRTTWTANQGTSRLIRLAISRFASPCDGLSHLCKVAQQSCLVVLPFAHSRALQPGGLSPAHRSFRTTHCKHDLVCATRQLGNCERRAHGVRA